MGKKDDDFDWEFVESPDKYKKKKGQDRALGCGVVVGLVLLLAIAYLLWPSATPDKQEEQTQQVVTIAPAATTLVATVSPYAGGVGETMSLRGDGQATAIKMTYFDGEVVREVELCSSPAYPHVCFFGRPAVPVAHQGSFHFIVCTDRCERYPANIMVNHHHLVGGDTGNGVRYFIPELVSHRLTGEQLIGGINELIEVRSNYRVNRLGYAYFDGTHYQEMMLCHDVTEQTICRMPRPALRYKDVSSFALVICDETICVVRPANPVAELLRVEWGYWGPDYNFLGFAIPE
jgi:hypothetical protein